MKCKICGSTDEVDAAGFCGKCWEVAYRLKEFVKYPEGRKFVKKILMTAPMEGKGRL